MTLKHRYQAPYISMKKDAKSSGPLAGEKRSTMQHPYLKQKIPLGLLPYVQSNLLAKYVRGDIEEYPSFLMK